MGSEDDDATRGIAHNQVRDELAERLRAYAENPIAPEDASVGVESGIQTSGRRGQCRPDARLDVDLDRWSGCAFEVKVISRSEMQANAIRQLTNYRAAGYQPILVIPEWLFESRNTPTDSHTAITFENVLRWIDASILEISSADPIEFSTPQLGRNFAAPGLEEFLTSDKERG